MNKPILCLDFDGVCHSYASGWKGAAIIPDPPVVGMWEFLWRAVDVFEVNIFSSRSNQVGGLEAMRQWFVDHASEKEREELIDKLVFPREKPAAMVGIDDRVLTFRGEWPDVEELRGFRTWMQDPRGATNRFPRGKVTEHDEGELKIAMYTKDGTIFVDFGKKVAWLGLDANSARDMAKLLLKHADTL